jgi:hypothetical protein
MDVSDTEIDLPIGESTEGTEGNGRKELEVLPVEEMYRDRSSPQRQEEQHGAAARPPAQPRLVIREMVLENFKSYAGAQRVGPFHKVGRLSLCLCLAPCLFVCHLRDAHLTCC